MDSVKQLYNNPEACCDAFIASEEGKKYLEQTISLYPKYNKLGKDTRLAINNLIEGMNEWLYNHTPHLHEMDIEAFMDTYHKDLCVGLHKKLM